ncbi:MAG: polysaccharide deacetylase family protein [Thermaerobacter sp.]|nr:polysaccharide deacetylase family protein [Thermaerobacter sp.]
MRRCGGRGMLLLGAAASALWLGAAAVGGPPPGAVYRGDARHPRVALECNVDWGGEYLPGMLDVLRQDHAHITFFLTGAWAQAHPALARELAAAGEEIGNHGWRHVHVAALSEQANRREMAHGQRVIAAASGVVPRLYAPPYGELSPAVLAAAAGLGLRVIMWTADTVDWQPQRTPAVIRQRAVVRAKNGALILIHPTARTLAALPGILAGLRRRGYQVTTVSQVLGSPP